MTKPWPDLNTQQLGRMAEYIARLAFARVGYRIYVPEVDDQGVDFLVHKPDEGYTRVQVKSVRGFNYIFARKAYFQPSDDLCMCVVRFGNDASEHVYRVPSNRWRSPCSVFVNKDYEGLKSAPEYGINLSAKSLEALEQYRMRS